MRFLPCFFLLTVAFAPAWAGGLADPFDTEAMAPLKPSLRLAARVGEAPCATALPTTALTAVDAVDLALCNHPQTREVWASARAQAALVGVAQGGWLPSLDASAGATRFQNENNPFTRTSAALTLSWLLVDFGQRSANVENARQLLNAAAATQDATVQTLFLAALQTYYAAQATQAAVVSANEAERAAGESRCPLRRWRRHAGRPLAGADGAVAGDAEPHPGRGRGAQCAGRAGQCARFRRAAGDGAGRFAGGADGDGFPAASRCLDQ
jgi:hypothetical protein